MSTSIVHKRGDTFEWILVLPEDDYPDGYFVGWTPSCQIRSTNGRLIAELETSWADPVEDTRSIRFFFKDTTGWKLGDHEADVQCTRTSDGFVRSTETFAVKIVKDITITTSG
jgi:hypothetical protein